MVSDRDLSPHGTDMPPWIPRVIGLVILSVLGAWAGVWVLYKLRSLLTTLLLALFISFAFEPAVQYLARRGYRRGVATGAVFGVATIAGLAFVALTLPPLVVQTANLMDRIPDWLADLSFLLEARLGVEVDLTTLTSDVLDVSAAVQGYAASLASGVLGLGSAVLNILLRALTLMLFTFYLLADGPRVRRAILSVIRPERQEEVATMWEIAITKTGGYVYSRALLGVFSAVFTFASLRLFEVPFALPLSIWVGVVSQFLPAIGTYIAAAVPTLVAAAADPVKGALVLGALIGYQMVENYLLAPRITARTMSMHPAIAFGAALAGASILGLAGAVIALPVAATIQALISTYVQFHDVAEVEQASQASSTRRSILDRAATWATRKSQSADAA